MDLPGKAVARQPVSLDTTALLGPPRRQTPLVRPGDLIVGPVSLSLNPSVKVRPPQPTAPCVRMSHDEDCDHT